MRQSTSWRITAPPRKSTALLASLSRLLGMGTHQMHPEPEPAGVAHCEGLPDHVRKHFPRDDPGYFFSTVSVRNYLGVTGACMLTPAATFRSVGGFDEQFAIDYSDIDYCLKLRQRRLRTVYTPHAELYHFDSTSRRATVATNEIELYLQKWSSITRNDPYYNKAFLNTAPPDFSLRVVGLPIEAV